MVDRQRRNRRPRRGIALLEVVISVSLLLVAMGAIGIVFRNGQTTAERTEQMIRAQMLTERLIAEMDLGILEMDDREQTGYFGEEAPAGMSWSVTIEPHEQVEGLLDVDIELYIGDPDGSENERIFLLATRIQRPEPRGIDFENDFGLDQEQLDQITEAIPGGVAAFDPTNFDPRSLASLDLDSLVELWPTLVQAFGGQFANDPRVMQLLQAVQSGDLSALQGAASQFGQAGGLQVPAGGNQGNAGGRRGGDQQGGDQGSGRRPSWRDDDRGDQDGGNQGSGRPGRREGGQGNQDGGDRPAARPERREREQGNQRGGGRGR